MQHKRITLILLLLATVALAGCTQMPELPDPGTQNDDNGDTGNTDTGNAGGPGVSITGPTCIVDGTPCSETQITEFSLPEITVSIRNTGDTPASVALNENTLQGQGVLDSKCSEYQVREFRAEVASGSSVEDVADRQTVTVEPGEELDMTWFVELRSGVDPDETSLTCVFRFRPAITQSLVTVQQVQVRSDEWVRRVPDLSYDTTAQIPVELVIDADRSVIQERVGGTVRPFQVQTYLRNRGNGEIADISYREGQERIRLTASGLDTECSDRQIDVSSGEEQVREQGMLCRVTPEQADGSQIYDITAETTYEYVYRPTPVELAVGTLEADQ